MSKELQETFFNTSGTIITPESITKNTRTPFKDNPIFTLMHDTLARRHQHHLITRTDFAAFLNKHFIEALIDHLSKTNIAPRLQKSSAVFIDVKQLLLELTDVKTIETDFSKLRDWIKQQDKAVLFAIANTDLLNTDSEICAVLLRQIKSFITLQECRLVILQSANANSPFENVEDAFTTTPLVSLPGKDNMMILRLKRDDLEEYHHVTIPNELLSETYDLTTRFLSSQHAMEKTLLLLDSCAARASAAVKPDQSVIFKSTVTMPEILEVLSEWTKIPVSNLSLQQFNYDDFLNSTQKRIFGQDLATTFAASELQQAYSSLREKHGPFASFLLAGPSHTGKKTMSAAITIQLFRQINLLYTVNYNSDTNSFGNVRLQRYMQNRFHSLDEVINSSPCAVLLFENIEKAPAYVHQAVQEILATGFYHDLNGRVYDFRQSIILMTTSLNNSLLTKGEVRTDKPLGFGQLITDELANNINRLHDTASQQALVDKLREELSQTLPPALCRQTCVLPFFKLQKRAIEQIIQMKISTLCRQLAVTRDIKLEYAAEVPRFLSAQITGGKESDNQPVNIEKALRQFYACIESTLSTRPGRHLCPAKLYLTLNERGETLKCEWQLDRIEESA